MPYIPDEEFKKTLERIRILEESVLHLKKLTENMRGSPIIIGYPNKRLDITETFNTATVLKRIATAEFDLLNHTEDISESSEFDEAFLFGG